ncbi:Protein MAIN-LIKE 1 [Glycine max]|nr:Protein MAIN-LIKE 1 [Glycine max]
MHKEKKVLRNFTARNNVFGARREGGCNVAFFSSPGAFDFSVCLLECALGFVFFIVLVSSSLFFVPFPHHWLLLLTLRTPPLLSRSCVIGRALEREDNHHLDDVPQQRRPTTSARRQQEVAAIVEDVPHVDDVAEEVFQHVEEVVDDAEGFPGEPVLTAYVDHVAVIEHPELKLSSHGRKVQKFGKPATEIKGLLHKETSSFHLLVGEVIITLDDVATLLHPSIIGALHSFETLHVDEAVLMLVELLKVPGDEARAETVQCHGAYVRLSWLREIYQSKCEAEHWTIATHAYLWHLLGCTFFANKSATHVYVMFLDAFRDLSQSGSYAWGAATLCWIYEHFPFIAEAFTDPDYDERSPRACRWTFTKASTKSLPALTYRKRLDRLTIIVVCWMSYGDHHTVRELDLISYFSGHIQWGPVVVIHRPERVVRQFGYVQTIPPHSPGSRLSFEDIDDRWMHFSEYLAPVGQICVVSGQCAPNYMHWFYMISHLFKTPTHAGDPPRHPHVKLDETCGTRYA